LWYRLAGGPGPFPSLAPWRWTRSTRQRCGTEGSRPAQLHSRKCGFWTVLHRVTGSQPEMRVLDCAAQDHRITAGNAGSGLCCTGSQDHSRKCGFWTVLHRITGSQLHSRKTSFGLCCTGSQGHSFTAGNAGFGLCCTGSQGHSRAGTDSAPRDTARMNGAPGEEAFGYQLSAGRFQGCGGWVGVRLFPVWQVGRINRQSERGFWGSFDSPVPDVGP